MVVRVALHTRMRSGCMCSAARMLCPLCCQPVQAPRELGSSLFQRIEPAIGETLWWKRRRVPTHLEARPRTTCCWPPLGKSCIPLPSVSFLRRSVPGTRRLHRPTTPATWRHSPRVPPTVAVPPVMRRFAPRPSPPCPHCEDSAPTRSPRCPRVISSWRRGCPVTRDNRRTHRPAG